MIIVDVETTGNYPGINGLREIGAVDFLNPSNRFSIELCTRPDAEIDRQVQAVHKFREEDFYDTSKPGEEEAIKRFNSWAMNLEERTLAGMNPSFDEGFLMDAYKRHGLKWIFPYRLIDQHTLAYASILKNGFPIPHNEYGLSAVYGDLIMEYVGIPPEPRPHKGINGAVWEAEAISRLIYGRNLLPEFSRYSIPKYLAKEQIL